MPRPVPTFHDFVGHKKLIDRLRRQLAGAQSRGEPFPHTFFIGASGLGKTLLARALAAEYGTQIAIVSGDITTVNLGDRLADLGRNDFIFIDEAHLLKGRVQELLYGAIDNLQVRTRADSIITSGSGDVVAAREIKPCTILLATDQPGHLLNALQKRMALQVALNHYSIAELKEIVDRMATGLNLLLSPQAARLIATVSAGLPRRAKHHLQNLRNHFPDAESGQLSIHEVREFLADFDVDAKGLGIESRQYMLYLQETGAASLESLAIYLGLDSDFVRRQIEPLLLRERLVKIGPGGRRLTDAGRTWISLKDSSTD